MKRNSSFASYIKGVYSIQSSSGPDHNLDPYSALKNYLKENRIKKAFKLMITKNINVEKMIELCHENSLLQNDEQIINLLTEISNIRIRIQFANGITKNTNLSKEKIDDLLKTANEKSIKNFEISLAAKNKNVDQVNHLLDNYSIINPEYAIKGYLQSKHLKEVFNLMQSRNIDIDIVIKLCHKKGFFETGEKALNLLDEIKDFDIKKLFEKKYEIIMTSGIL